MDKEHNGFEDLPSLVNSRDWAEYVSILRERQVFLRNKVFEFVRAQDLFNAYGTLCKLDDIDKTLEIVNKKLKEIQKGGKT